MTIKKIGILTGGGVMLKAILNCRLLPGFKLCNIWYNVKSF